jgi:sulfate transport system substrate-binding protein
VIFLLINTIKPVEIKEKDIAQGLSENAMILTFDLYGPGFGPAPGGNRPMAPQADSGRAEALRTFPSFFRLFDRRTGGPAVALGLPVACTAADIDEARALLLHNRDPRHFEVRIDSPASAPDTDKDTGPVSRSRFNRFGQLPDQIGGSSIRPFPSKERKVTTMFPVTKQPGASLRLRAVGRTLLSASRLGALAVLAAAAMLSAPAAARAELLLNASYDPTRELYRAINEAFTAKWVADGNEAPQIENSHGGSGSQARAVIEGLDAQVVTLALAADIDKIAKEGKLAKDWQSKLPHNSSPYTSTIVFLVREGNPKGIKDWGDLVNDGVEVITPNPKTSGGARWNFLAAWAWAEKNGKDPQEFVKALYTHVPVLDKGARDSTTTFAQREIGDVLLAWENEAYLALNELGDDKFDIVVPSISVLAEPPVAVVDANIHSDGQKKLAEAYLNFLYAPEGQAIIFKNYYRGWDTSKADPADVARFPKLDLVDISHFGGWGEAQKKFFADGGVFDQIYSAK